MFDLSSVTDPVKSEKKVRIIHTHMAFSERGRTGWLIRILLMSALMLLDATVARGVEPEFDFNIPPSTADKALVLFAKQADIQVLFSYEELSAVQLNGLYGRYTVKSGIQILIDNMCLEIRTSRKTKTIDGVAKQNGDFFVMKDDKCKSRKFKSIAYSVFAASLGVSGVSAQNATSSQPAALDEIIVTAQKRAESLQETPVAITAFSSNDLEAQRVFNVMDLMNKVPSLTLAPFAGTRSSPNLFIRGMGNLIASSTKDMATGIYIDGVPVARSVGLAVDIADLERVEVLRGPQGTLWGRNTTAGAINFITKNPDDELSADILLTAGSWGLRSGQGRLNVPITDKLFTRIAYMREENDGWIKNRNATLPKQINFNEDRKKEAMRVALRYEISNDVIVDYSFDRSEMIFGNHFYQAISGATAVSGRQRSSNSVIGLTPSVVKTNGHAFSVSWDVGGAVLKSITSYRDLNSHMDMNYADLFAQDNKQGQHQFSEELNFVGSMLNERLKYAMGLFYFEESSHESIASLFSSGTSVDSWLVKADGKSKATYGQFTWNPPILDDRLGVTVGLRYTKDARKAKKYYLQADLSPTVSPGTIVFGDRNFNSLNPSVVFDYAFSSNINGYLKYSTGYRAGGFSTQSTPVYFGRGFDQEDVVAWEVGVKSDLLDRRLRMNIAAFRNKYTDLQVDQSRVPSIFTDTLNAGSALVKGVEIESAAIITNGLTVNFFYSWLDGDYKSYIDNGVQLESQREMPNTPKHQFGAGVEYVFPHLTIGNLTLRIDYRKQDESFANPNLFSLSPGYKIWNTRLQLSEIPSPYGAFRLAVWGKNLNNEIYRVATTNLGVPVAQFGAPRSYGIDLGYKF